MFQKHLYIQSVHSVDLKMSSNSRGVRSGVQSNHVKTVSSNKSSTTTTATDNNPTQTADKAARAAPTPEQIRMAQITDNSISSQQDQALQDMIDKVNKF